MTQSLIIGVDSGGTRTNVSICGDSSSNVLHSYEVSDALSGYLTPREYANTLRRILAPAERFWRDSDDLSAIGCLFVSAAGFSPSVRDDFLEAAEVVVPEMLGGNIKAAGFANDAVSLIMGSDCDAIVIAGTGSNVMVRSSDGRLFQSGGHEWVACDYGSGFWIGLRAIRIAYKDLDADNHSVLLQRLRQSYGLRQNDDQRLIAKLRDLSIADENMKREIARFASDVCSAAERGDASAQNVVKVEAEELADVLAGALRRHFGHSQLVAGIRLLQCGSLLGNEFYRDAFEAQVERRLRTSEGEKLPLTWIHEQTAIRAALALATALQADTKQLLEIDLAFRPLVVRFD